MLTSWLKGKGARNNCDNDEMGILWAYSKHARQWWTFFIYKYICSHGILTCNAFLREKLIEAQVSPFFLLVDESRNETLEQHLVMYACL
jgi:hypothetical protein